MDTVELMREVMTAHVRTLPKLPTFVVDLEKLFGRRGDFNTKSMNPLGPNP